MSRSNELIDQYRRGYRAIHHLKSTIKASEDLLDTLCEAHGEVEERLAIELLQRGPITLNGLEYSHEYRDQCDKVAMRPVTSPVNPPAIPTRRSKHALR